MARRNLEDSTAYGLEIRNKLKLLGNPTTLGAALTITADYPTFQQYDAGGASRNITLPARALANDGLVWIFSNISTAAEDLVIKDSGATTILTVPPGSLGLVIASGSSEAPETRGWAVGNIGGEDLAIADDLVVSGDLTVTGATVLNGTVALGNAAADTIGLYGVTKISQRASSLQATSNVASSTDFAAAQLAVLHEIMETLRLTGIWKGSA